MERRGFIQTLLGGTAALFLARKKVIPGQYVKAPIKIEPPIDRDYRYKYTSFDNAPGQVGPGCCLEINGQAVCFSGPEITAAEAARVINEEVFGVSARAEGAHVIISSDLVSSSIACKFPFGVEKEIRKENRRELRRKYRSMFLSR